MLSDAELLDLVEAAKEGRKGDPGPRGAQGVGIAEINQPSPTELVFVLSDGSTKRVSLPAPKDGEPGEAGPQGEKGATGAPGKDGRDGADALPGRDGKDGAPGAPGLQIESAVVTEAGRLLIGLSDNNVINAGYVRGEKGDKGERGFTGAIGAPGRDGNTILSGDRAPSSEDGNDGDFWIDMSAPDLAFYGKQGDQWFKVAGLKQDPNAQNNQLRATPMIGGSAPEGGFSTKDIALKRGERDGLPPAGFDACATQFQWNWVAETSIDLAKLQIQLLETRLTALEEVAGRTLLYTVESITDADPSGPGFFSVNNADPNLVTRIHLNPLDKNNEPLPIPVDGDTLLFVAHDGSGIEHRYIIDDASAGIGDLVVESPAETTSGHPWVTGVEYETFLFPTNTPSVVVDVVAPVNPDLGTIWIDVSSLIWYAWDGAAWIPAHLPPSFEARIEAIENDKLDAADADARYLQLTGGTVTGNLQATERLTVNKPKVAGAASTSFEVKGWLDGSENQQVLFDYRSPVGDTTNSMVRYKGSMVFADSLVTKQYVDDSTADISTNAADIAKNAADIASNAADIASNATDIATNTGQIAANSAELDTKLDEAAGDARYLRLATGGTVEGQLNLYAGIFIDEPRSSSGATTSFQVNGNLDGAEHRPLLYDYRYGTGSSEEARMLYRGPVTSSAEITTKEYVDNAIFNSDRFLKLTGGTLTGTLFADQGITIQEDRHPTIASSSFAIKGNIGSSEDQSLLYDWRQPSSSTQSAAIRYTGAITFDDEITTKQYVDNNIAATYDVFLRLDTGGIVVGQITSAGGITIDEPRRTDVATNSFVVKGNLNGAEGQSLLYDYREAATLSANSRVVYEGSVTQDKEITTKEYVDNAIAASAGGDYLPLTGGEMSGELRADGGLTIQKPLESVPTNSFILRGDVDGVSNVNLLMDYRGGSGGGENARVLYNGMIEVDNEIVTKKYVDTAITGGLQRSGAFDYGSGTRVLVGVLEGIETYRKIVVQQNYAGAPQDPPGFGMTTAAGTFTFSSSMSNGSMNWTEPSPLGLNQNSMTTYSIRKTEMESQGYFRDSGKIALMANDVAQNYGSPDTGYRFTFEFMRGNGSSTTGGYTLTATCDYISVEGQHIHCFQYWNCNAFGITGLLNLRMYQPTSTPSFGYWIVTDDY